MEANPATFSMTARRTCNRSARSPNWRLRDCGRFVRSWSKSTRGHSPARRRWGRHDERRSAFKPRPGRRSSRWNPIEHGCKQHLDSHAAERAQSGGRTMNSFFHNVALLPYQPEATPRNQPAGMGSLSRVRAIREAAQSGTARAKDRREQPRTRSRLAGATNSPSANFLKIKAF